MKAFKGFNKDLTCRGSSMRGKEFIQKKRIAVMRDSCV